MRVVSMVPSWTETLLWAGVQVVGRTRFCHHPASLVESIPIVGGTKDWILPKVKALSPNLLILDKEENPLAMAEAGLPFWASHVQGIHSMPDALLQLGERLGNEKLLGLAGRWRAVVDTPVVLCEPANLPGVLEWGRLPERAVARVVYVIWRDPWMAVAPQTFIGSVLAKLGMVVKPSAASYPQFEPTALPKDTLLLLSSEPYPFLRKREGLADLGLPYAFVDGESFSWFGLRSLQFLEKALEL